MLARVRLAYLPALAALAACSTNVGPGDGGDAHRRTDADPAPLYCSIGTDVPNANLPAGYCMKAYSTIFSPRVLTVAPNGDLFVAAPSQYAPGGSGGGPGGIAVLTDDNEDGVAEVSMFVTNVPDVHGIAITGGYVYFTTQNTIYRTAYSPGDRVARGSLEDLQLPQQYGMGGRWTHGLAASPAGHLFSSRGEYATCGGSSGGSIYEVGPSRMDTLATGFRNPMYMRCHFADEVCMSSELGEDQTPGAHEKLLFVRPSTDFGYPCCFGANAPRDGTDCSMVAQEDESIPLSDTPFGMDWERGVWEGDFRDGLFVALHGSFYSSPQYQGAAVVYFHTDPTTHRPTGEPTTFISSWGNHQPGRNPANVTLSRPADIAFAPDGRMFIADDTGNYVYYVAPTTLHAP